MNLLRTLYRGEHSFDFPAMWKKGLAVSIALVIISVAALGIRGLNLGIEFEGGTSWEVEAPGASVADARDALSGTDAESGKIQTVGTDSIRVRADVDDSADVLDITARLADFAGVEASDVSVTTVGPSWGDQITGKARNALIWFFVIVAGYIAIRLEWKMAIGALVAVAHDILISVGVYAVFQFEVTPATVIAFLTIMGYSLYDTIVVYDKVREITARVGATGRYTYTEMMNLALNQVLARSINTTITSIIPVLSMLVIGSFILGATTLQEFSIALLVGLLVGGYSSLFVASAVVARLKEQEPEYQQIAKKVAKRGGGDEGTRRIAAEDATFGVQAGRMRTRSGGGTATTTAPKKTKKAKKPADGDSSTDDAPANESSGSGSAKKATSKPTDPTAIPPRPRKTKRKK